MTNVNFKSDDIRKVITRAVSARNSAENAYDAMYTAGLREGHFIAFGKDGCLHSDKSAWEQALNLVTAGMPKADQALLNMTPAEAKEAGKSNNRNAASSRRSKICGNFRRSLRHREGIEAQAKMQEAENAKAAEEGRKPVQVRAPSHNKTPEQQCITALENALKYADKVKGADEPRYPVEIASQVHAEIKAALALAKKQYKH